MTRAWRALIIAPDNFPGKYDDYVAACRELKLEPNGHCYLVCLISTADVTRTLLTVDLPLLPDIYEAGLRDQATLPGADRSTEIVSGTGPSDPGMHPLWDLGGYRSGDQGLPRHLPDPEKFGPGLPAWGFVPPSRIIPAPPSTPPEPPEPVRRPDSPSQQQNPFEGFCEPASPYARQPNRPQVKLVLDLDRATLKGVAVWNPPGKLVIAAKADDAVKAALREAFADTAAQVVIDRLWPPHAPPAGLADLDTAITVLQAGLEPQTLLLKMINAAARVAAVHAGFGVVAPLVGQFAEDLCKQFVRPPTPTDEIMVNVLSSIDIDLYAAANELANCAPLRELTVQETSLGLEKLFEARCGVDTPIRGPKPARPSQDPRGRGPGGPSPDPRGRGPGGPSPDPRGRGPGGPSPDPRGRGPGGPSPDPRGRGPGGPSPVLTGRQSTSMSAVGLGLPHAVAAPSCCT